MLQLKSSIEILNQRKTTMKNLNDLQKTQRNFLVHSVVFFLAQTFSLRKNIQSAILDLKKLNDLNLSYKLI